MNRVEMVDKLIENTLRLIKIDAEGDDFDYVENIIREGFVGFADFTNKELKEEWLEVFGEDINVEGEEPNNLRSLLIG